MPLSIVDIMNFTNYFSVLSHKLTFEGLEAPYLLYGGTF